MQFSPEARFEFIFQSIYPDGSQIPKTTPSSILKVFLSESTSYSGEYRLLEKDKGYSWVINGHYLLKNWWWYEKSDLERKAHFDIW